MLDGLKELLAGVCEVVHQKSGRFGHVGASGEDILQVGRAKRFAGVEVLEEFVQVAKSRSGVGVEVFNFL